MRTEYPFYLLVFFLVWPLVLVIRAISVLRRRCGCKAVDAPPRKKSKAATTGIVALGGAEEEASIWNGIVFNLMYHLGT